MHIHIAVCVQYTKTMEYVWSDTIIGNTHSLENFFKNVNSRKCDFSVKYFRVRIMLLIFLSDIFEIGIQPLELIVYFLFIFYYQTICSCIG